MMRGDIPVDGRLCTLGARRRALFFERICDSLGGLFEVAPHEIRDTGGDKSKITKRLNRYLLGVASDDPSRMRWFLTHRHITSPLMWCCAVFGDMPDGPNIKSSRIRPNSRRSSAKKQDDDDDYQNDNDCSASDIHG